MARLVPGSARCAGCGYCLRGLRRGEACPECGHDIDDSVLRPIDSPWWRRAGRAYAVVVAAVVLAGLPTTNSEADFGYVRGWLIAAWATAVLGIALSFTPARALRRVWVAWTILTILLVLRLWG